MILSPLVHKSLMQSYHPSCKFAVRYVLSNRLLNFVTHFCSKSHDGSSDSKVELPPEPQNCCMSGCANCVWIAYAEELAKLLNDEGETARKKILENVKDPNLRAFLMLELSHLFKKK